MTNEELKERLAQAEALIGKQAQEMLTIQAEVARLQKAVLELGQTKQQLLDRIARAEGIRK